MTHMYDLSIEALADGGLRLEQSAGSLEEPAVIDLHPVQIRLIAERAGLLAPAQSPAWPPGFERRMVRLRKKAGALADFLGSVSFLPRAGGSEEELQAHDLWQAIADLMADFDIAGDPAPEPEPAAAPKPCKPEQGALFDGGQE